MTPAMIQPRLPPVSHRPLSAGLLLGLLVAVGGCTNLPFYAQAVRGHLSVMSKRVEIEALLDDPALDPSLRENLTLVLEVRDFASSALGLPENGSYRSYAQLDRPYVVWNVVAAPEYSIAPKQWCFAFVGCLAYKGYYQERKARGLADKLERRGYEVVVGGVAAYSTLGRFEDPFLDTMIGYTDARTANLIFHELAHQKLYVKGDSAFNEAFATYVAQEGVRRWFAATERPAQEVERYRTRQARARAFNRLVLTGRMRLQAVYADESLDDDARAEAKQAALERLHQEYAVVRDGAWGGYAGYDAWFASLNNARLASVATYHRWVPAFSALMRQAGGDFGAFYAAVQALADEPPQVRRASLQRLLAIASQDDAPSAAAGQSAFGRSSRY
ncbi:MAG: aminopeptidase [Pseudomonadota bacterium]